MGDTTAVRPTRPVAGPGAGAAEVVQSKRCKSVSCCVSERNKRTGTETMNTRSSESVR